MITVLDIMPVLTVFPYALIYYAILLISSGLAVFGILRARPTPWRKLLTAFGVIFGLQAILLALSLLSYQGYEIIRPLFPLLHRGLNFLALLWFAWALSSQGNRNSGFLFPLSLSILVILAVSLAPLLWLPSASAESFNASWMDVAWAAASIFILLLAGWAYLRGEDANPLEAILILGIAACGYMLHLALPNTGSLPGAVMISQLLYYPLFLALAWHQHENEVKTALPVAASASSERVACSAQVAASLLDVSLQDARPGILEALTRALSLYLMADLCAIVGKDAASPDASLLHAYDLIREEYLPAINLNARQNPLVLTHLESRTPLIINDENHTNPETLSLMLQTGYNQPGNLFLFPFSPASETAQFALLCLSPYTNRLWTQRDIERMRVVGPRLDLIIRQSSRKVSAPEDASTVLASPGPIARDKAITSDELAATRILLEKLKTDQRESQDTQTQEVQLWTQRQEWLEEQLDQLTATLQQKDQALADAQEAQSEKAGLEEALEKNARQMRQLKTALAQAQQLIERTPTSDEVGIPSANIEPTPGEVQEKWAPIDDTAPQEDTSLSSGRLLASQLLEELGLTRDACEKRGLVLRDLSEYSGEMEPWTRIRAREILDLLLTNACQASPRGALVEMGIYPGETPEGESTIEIHVTDRCGGLSQDEQTRFLKWMNRPGYPVPTGIGDARSLRKAAALVQACGGHWWIHSQLGQPTTYRVSIPMKNNQDATPLEGL